MVLTEVMYLKFCRDTNYRISYTLSKVYTDSLSLLYSYYKIGSKKDSLGCEWKKTF
jgi:hypothetical protein